MAKIQKLIDRLKESPKDFTWEELIKVLAHFGYTELKKGKTGGSRRKFANNGNEIISLHKPHPGSILKKYQVEDVIGHLTEKGLI
ncbi:MAG TPA: type II toxin-antitoxin system HicA family toxin [Chitinophagaceae bacterium]|nr:type II toxin-antitoxin system HicA family toxin [Chitinophagaceae bacterium]